MPTTRRWTIQVFIAEDDAGGTRAEATLRTHANTTLRAVGRAQTNPNDVNVPEIGDELATARALLTLADELLTATAEDIEAVGGGHANL